MLSPFSKHFFINNVLHCNQFFLGVNLKIMSLLCIFPLRCCLLRIQKKTAICFLHNLGPQGRTAPWRGADAVIWLRSDAVPGAVSGVDPGRPVDRMFLSVPGLRALSLSAALSLFVFPAESCHSPPSPPPSLCLSKNVNTWRIRAHV